ncbi:MAG: SipW-dependent-type signal peptide-containing protein [Acutalibacteraceae bacterium]|nr:SipW-dependent-type signal peptide-containing protein [Acutalibacteraceae bacterium]
MKRKILVFTLIIGVIAVSALGTLAYFTSEDTATNVVTAGNVKIALKERALAEDGTTLVPFENDQIVIMPASEVSKIVTVENTGDQPAFVRIKLAKSIILAEDKAVETDLSLVTYDINLKDWTEKDGWYYYNGPLAAGEETVPIITNVIFADSMSNIYQNSKVEIKIDAEATQSANNGDSATVAVGWPSAE